MPFGDVSAASIWAAPLASTSVDSVPQSSRDSVAAFHFSVAVRVLFFAFLVDRPQSVRESRTMLNKPGILAHPSR